VLRFSQSISKRLIGMSLQLGQPHASRKSRTANLSTIAVVPVGGYAHNRAFAALRGSGNGSHGQHGSLGGGFGGLNAYTPASSSAAGSASASQHHHQQSALHGELSRFARRLTGALGLIGPTLHLDAKRLDWYMGDGTAAKLANFVARSRVRLCLTASAFFCAFQPFSRLRDWIGRYRGG
jgi:hypothetical protein